MKPLRIFVGYDEREAVAYHVLAHSIIRHASGPVSITPLRREALARIHTRPRGPLDSTDFSITRFLVPFLAGHEGMALYLDCDMLFRADVWSLPWHDDGPAVFVCQHDYVPKFAKKFLGETQTSYPRKNWSSLMLFNAAKCAELTPATVNQAPGLWLHRFQWVHDQIGVLPLEWNWLVGEYEENSQAKVYHYTLGGPWFGYTEGDAAAEWLAERRRMLGGE